MIHAAGILNFFASYCIVVVWTCDTITLVRVADATDHESTERPSTSQSGVEVCEVVVERKKLVIQMDFFRKAPSFGEK